MLIWLGVVETVLALVGIFGCVGLYYLIESVRDLSAALHHATREFQDVSSSTANELIGAIKGLLEAAQSSVKTAAQDFEESLNDDAEERTSQFHDLSGAFAEVVKLDGERRENQARELIAGIRKLTEAWEGLSSEIRTRYDNFDKAEKRALRQIQAIEYLEKLIVGLGGKRPGPSSISVPSEADAAAVEELTDAQQRELARAASGIDRDEPEL